MKKETNLSDTDFQTPRRGRRLIQLDPAGAGPLHARLYKTLRSHIARGVLAPGSRLPASRVLAEDLGVSRNTVTTALEQLAADGWIDLRRGSGAYVARPPDPVAPPAPTDSADDEPECLPFEVGPPGLDLFPLEAWRRIQARRWASLDRSALRQGRSAGYSELRRTIAEHLWLARGVPCSPDQIFITQSVRSGLGLAVRALTRPGDRAWVEDPAYMGSKSLMRAEGLDVHASPVDAEGFDCARASDAAPGARLALVTPQCQFPTGVTMSEARRASLLDWARSEDGWIVEDDYDSEYRFDGQSVSPLAGENGDRVVYIHSFNKTLFPALRIGFLVAPKALVGQFAAVRREFDDHPNVPAQMVLRDFIEEGWLDTHLRATRAAYAERRRVMIERVAPMLERWLDVDMTSSGLHLLARPKNDGDPALIQQAAQAQGVTLTLARILSETPERERRILLGFAPYSPASLVRAGERLHAAMQVFARS